MPLSPLLIPILALMIPIVAILSHHQRKMAELMHGRGSHLNEQLVREVQRLSMEVTDLRERVNQQAIEMDDLSALKPGPTSPPPAPRF